MSTPWYALQVRPRHEKQVARVLTDRDLEVFLPLYRTRHKWKTSTRTVDLPLFDGYVFSTFATTDRRTVLSVPGVFRIVSFGQTPTPLDPRELDAIKVVVGSERHVAPCEYLEAGDRVRIDCGALTGTEGILVKIRDEHRLVVSINLLKRSVAVTIDRDWIRPLRPKYPLAVAAAVSTNARPGT